MVQCDRLISVFIRDDCTIRKSDSPLATIVTYIPKKTLAFSNTNSYNSNCRRDNG